MYYFGPWDDPEGALARYLEQKDALHAGRKPRETTEGVTVNQLASDFLNHKLALVGAGELARRTFDDYKVVTDLLVAHLGKGRRRVDDLGPDDFAALRDKLARKWGPVRLANAIQRSRSVFKFAFDAGLIDRPVRFGPCFARPSKKVLRLHRAKQGPKLFTREEVRRMVDEAGTPLRAMILLGINCGFGNSDCGRLPLSALDLGAGWVTFPRPKTGIERRCPLWPETVAVLREALAKRPAAKKEEDAALVFVTRYGRPWAKATSASPIVLETTKLMRALGINGRKGRGFYTLRHTFRTVADEARDQPAADFIMGHEIPHISSIYRETISDARLRAVADHVHGWLFGPAEGGPEAEAAAT
jgi:integrase